MNSRSPPPRVRHQEDQRSHIEVRHGPAIPRVREEPPAPEVEAEPEEAEPKRRAPKK